MKFFSKVTLLNRKQLDTWKLVSIFKVVYFVFKVICWKFSHQINTYVHTYSIFYHVTVSIDFVEKKITMVALSDSVQITVKVKDETVET